VTAALAAGTQLSPSKAPECPYAGLRPFTEHNAHLFFGRDQQRDDCVRRLQAHRFLAVVGMSGAGKSSLVRAGIVPVLRMGMLAGGSKPWRVATMRPGRHPRSALARALAKEFAAERASLSAIEAALGRSSRGLVDAVAELGGRECNLLLVVDQFEELFRLGRDLERTAGRSAEKASFVELLLAPYAQIDLPIYVVITMRSDFLGHCATFNGLPDALNQGQFLVPRLSRLQLEDAIASPADVVGLNLSHALVQRVLNDATNLTDELPVVQHALMRTYQHWLEDVSKREAWGEEVTVTHYEQSGTVKKALSSHGNHVLGALDAGARQSAELLFRRITRSRGPRFDEEFAADSATRDPAPRSVILKLLAAEGVANANAALERALLAFRDPGDPVAGADPQQETGAPRFLMRSDQEPAEGAQDEEIDVTHEAILRRWDSLAEWIELEEEDAATYRKLENIARSLKGHKIRGKDLKAFTDWWDKRKPNVEWARRYHDLTGLLPRSERPANGSERTSAAPLSRRSEAELARLQAEAFEKTQDYLHSCGAAEKRAHIILLFGGLIAALVMMGSLAWVAYSSVKESRAGAVSEARRQQFVALTKTKEPPTLSSVGDAWKKLSADERSSGDVQNALEDFRARRLEAIRTQAQAALAKGCSEEAALLYAYADASMDPAPHESDSSAQRVQDLFKNVVATAALSTGPYGCLRSSGLTCERLQLESNGDLLASCGGTVGSWHYKSEGDGARVESSILPTDGDPDHGRSFVALKTAGGLVFLQASRTRSIAGARGAPFFIQHDAGAPLAATIPDCTRAGALVATGQAGRGVRLAVACDANKVLATSIADPEGWLDTLQRSPDISRNAFASLTVRTISRSLQHIYSVAWVGQRLALAMDAGLAIASDNGAMTFAESTQGAQVFTVRSFSDPTVRRAAYGTVQTSSAQARVGIVDDTATDLAPPIKLERSTLENFRVVTVVGAKELDPLGVLAAGAQPATAKDEQSVFFINKGAQQKLTLSLDERPERVGDLAAAATPTAFLLAVSLPGRIRILAPTREFSTEKTSNAERWQHLEEATGLTLEEDRLEFARYAGGQHGEVKPWSQRFPGFKPQPAQSPARN